MSEQAAENDPEPPGIDAMMSLHSGALLRYAARLVRNDESAQDLVQEAFLLYLKAPPRQTEPRRVRNWLYRVTHNLCVDWIRKEQRMRETCEQMEPPPPAPPASAALVADETREALGQLLARLTENQRAVVVLKFQERKSYREISEITGLSIGNVGFQIHDALKKLGGFARKEELI